MSGPNQRRGVGWRWTLAVLTWLLAACTDEPDVVAYPLQDVDSGMPSDSGATAVDRCSTPERIRQSPLPEELVLDLYFSTDCSIPIEDFVSPDAGERGLSLERLKSLLGPMSRPEPGADRSIASLCEQFPGGQFPVPRDNPDRIVLCPNACKFFKDWIMTVLALDGCDESTDDAGVAQ